MNEDTQMQEQFVLHKILNVLHCNKAKKHLFTKMRIE